MEQVESIEMCIIVNFSRVLNVFESLQSIKVCLGLLRIATGTMRIKSEQCGSNRNKFKILSD